jgi:hypothetical protein
MLLIGPNLFMDWSVYLIFDIQCLLIQVKIKVSSINIKRQSVQTIYYSNDH